MYPKLLTLYGPFELNSYNTSIALGIGVFIFLANRRQLALHLMSSSSFINSCIESALAGILGGRILHILCSLDEYPTWYSMIQIWDGGLSILGGFLGITTFAFITIWLKKAPFAILDVAALYAPLIHGIARIGCFLVGCCHGAPTHSPLSVIYTHPQVCAPLGIPLHPSQLYSSLLFFILFALLYWYAQNHLHKGFPGSGKLLMLYIMGMSFERFIVDFTRGDRILISAVPHLSLYQLIAAVLFFGGAVGYGVLRRTSVRLHESV